jgi:amino acid transporter
MQPEPATSTAVDQDDARLEALGYKPQLNRALGFFSNFAVAFTYLSPMVGIYSLFVLGVGTAGPSYVWLTWIPVAGMLLVALVFGELASHYPVAGALYQYSKFNVGPAYGWFVGWFYGLALLITVAAVDTGGVTYVAALTHNWFDWNLDPTDHLTILLITIILLAIQTTLNITGVKVMGLVARIGVFVEIIGTLGIALILWAHGFNHSISFLFSSQGVDHGANIK